MEYITVEKGIVTGHYNSSEAPEAEVIEVTDWNGIVGTDVRLYDWENNGAIRPQQDLIADGLFEDNRGIWYSCIDQNSFEITEIGVKPPDGLEITKLVPTTPYDEWNGTAWITNTELKIAVEKQQSIDLAQQKYIDRLGETMDKLLGYIASTNPLTAPQQLFVDEFRNDYADYIAKRDA